MKKRPINVPAVAMLNGIYVDRITARDISPLPIPPGRNDITPIRMEREKAEISVRNEILTPRERNAR